MIINKLLILKVLELVLTCTCVTLDYFSFSWDADIGMLVTGTFIGYLIIIAGNAAGTVMETGLHKRIDIFYSLVGVVLFIASGAVIIDHTNKIPKREPKSHPSTVFGILVNAFLTGISEEYFRGTNLTKGSLAIINGAVLLLDAILTQRSGKATFTNTHSLVATSSSQEINIMQST